MDKDIAEELKNNIERLQQLDYASEQDLKNLEDYATMEIKYFGIEGRRKTQSYNDQVDISKIAHGKIINALNKSVKDIYEQGISDIKQEIEERKKHIKELSIELATGLKVETKP